MYSVPNLAPERVNILNQEVTICNVPRNNIQIGTMKEPCLVMRMSPPYGKQLEETDDNDDFSLTIDLCDVRQIRFFEQLEEEIKKQCKDAFGDGLPMKSIVKDGFVKIKMRKITDVTNKGKTKLAVTDLGSQDKVILIVRVSCLWKSSTNVGASIRVIRVLLLEKGQPEALPDFVLD